VRKLVPPGSSPGTIRVDPSAPKPIVTLFAYGPGELREEKGVDPAGLRSSRAGFPVLWLDVAGLGDEQTIRAVGTEFGLHPLALEDVLHVSQRPKVESYGDHHYFVSRVVVRASPLETEQVSLFLGKGFVVTFRESDGSCFEAVRERIRGGRGNIRQWGPPYLAYALVDTIVDGYFPALEDLGERLESLEDEIVTSPKPDSLGRVHAMKRDLLVLRRAVWPQREALVLLLRDGDSVVQKEMHVFLNDCYDHTVQLMDLVETYRDIASGLTEIYLSSMSHRLNEVMKVLTVITTIFMPLTFLAGVYGMNFDRSSPWNMPELGWRYGYLLCLAAMAVVAVGLYLWFRRKGWIGGGSGGNRAA